MNKHGGKRSGSGRRPGIVSKVKREISDLAKEHAERALLTLVSLHSDPGIPAAARVSAANAILDRAYGKAPQSLEHSGKDGGPITVEDSSARNIIASRIAGLAARSGTK